ARRPAVRRGDCAARRPPLPGRDGLAQAPPSAVGESVERPGTRRRAAWGRRRGRKSVAMKPPPGADHMARQGPDDLSLSRLNHQGPACEVYPDMRVGVATCQLCWPCGHSPTGDSQERGRAGLRVSAHSISQRASLLASEASWTINRDKLNYTLASVIGVQR